ncbi:MAG: hypothetical protein M1822_003948 [Bathelium mastoideum]|nr:MAG: hypothetical protein M1822_003948 [Bathelium mastoideum]
MFQHPNPLLCPVAHVIAIGLHNKAFCDPILQDPGKIWRAKIPTRKLSKIFRWRDDKLTEPIFREPRRNGRPSETPVPMRGLTARRYLRRLGHAAGFEDTLTQKCLRRGTGNAVDAVATAAERDQVMGHSHSDIFQFYINPRVRCDVQAAYLDEPSDRALMKVLGRMSLTYDPLAPKRLSAEDSRAVGQNPRVVELRQKRDRLSAKIKEMKGLGGRLSPSQEMQASLAEQRKELNAALVRERQRLRDHAGRRARQRYFRENDTTELEEKENREGDGPPGQDLNRPSDTYRLQERARIAKVLCKPYGQLSEPGCLDQRIEFVQTLTKLCARKEARRRDPPAPASRDVPVAQEPPVDLAAPPLACDPRQCLFCLGDERCADSQRPFRFCRPSKMRDHLARFHLKEFTAPEIQCPHPICKKDRTTLHGTMHFCRHCQSVHGIRLRLPLEAS